MNRKSNEYRSFGITKHKKFKLYINIHRTHKKTGASMKKIIVIWMAISLAFYLALIYSPNADDRDRMIYFHVPMAWISYLACFHCYICRKYFIPKEKKCKVGRYCPFFCKVRFVIRCPRSSYGLYMG